MRISIDMNAGVRQNVTANYIWGFFRMALAIHIVSAVHRFFWCFRDRKEGVIKLWACKSSVD